MGGGSAGGVKPGLGEAFGESGEGAFCGRVDTKKRGAFDDEGSSMVFV